WSRTIRRRRRKFSKLDNAALSVTGFTVARLTKSKVQNFTLFLRFLAYLQRIMIICSRCFVALIRVVERKFFEADRNGSGRRRLSGLLICKVRVFLIRVISYRIVHISGELHACTTGSTVPT